MSKEVLPLLTSLDKKFTLMDDIQVELLRLQSRLNTSTEVQDITDVTKLCRRFDEFRSDIVSSLDTVVKALSDIDNRIDALETYSRKNCLVLHGVTETEGEDSLSVAINLLNEKLKIPNFQLCEDMVDNCHRLGSSRADSKRPIIIKFISYMHRHKVWSNKKILKTTGFLLTESLTKRRATLFKQAREKFGARNAWTKDGKIVIAVSPNQKKVITDFSQLDLLQPDSASATEEGSKQAQRQHNTRAKAGRAGTKAGA